MDAAVDAAQRAAGFAGWGVLVTCAGILVTAGVGFATVRAARKGARVLPTFDVQPCGSSQRGMELRMPEQSIAVTDVKLLVLPPDTRVDGEVGPWARFAPNQRAVFFPLLGWGQGPGRVRVTWTPTHKSDPGVWESALPLA